MCQFHFLPPVIKPAWTSIIRHCSFVYRCFFLCFCVLFYFVYYFICLIHCSREKCWLLLLKSTAQAKIFWKMLTFWRFSIKFYQFTTFYHFLFQKLIFPYLPAVSIGATGEKIWSLEHFLSRFFCYIVLLLITKFIVFSWYNH